MNADDLVKSLALAGIDTAEKAQAFAQATVLLVAREKLGAAVATERQKQLQDSQPREAAMQKLNAQLAEVQAALAKLATQ